MQRVKFNQIRNIKDSAEVSSPFLIRDLYELSCKCCPTTTGVIATLSVSKAMSSTENTLFHVEIAITDNNLNWFQKLIFQEHYQSL